MMCDVRCVMYDVVVKGMCKYEKGKMMKIVKKFESIFISLPLLSSPLSSPNSLLPSFHAIIRTKLKEKKNKNENEKFFFNFGK
jgi:hypothetical protein